MIGVLLKEQVIPGAFGFNPCKGFGVIGVDLILGGKGD